MNSNNDHLVFKKQSIAHAKKLVEPTCLQRSYIYTETETRKLQNFNLKHARSKDKDKQSTKLLSYNIHYECNVPANKEVTFKLKLKLVNYRTLI